MPLKAGGGPADDESDSEEEKLIYGTAQFKQNYVGSYRSPNKSPKYLKVKNNNSYRQSNNNLDDNLYDVWQ